MPDLVVGQKVPNIPEAQASGAFTARIFRDTAQFNLLVKCEDERIVFKDEEGTGADRMMTETLQAALITLASKVSVEWLGSIKLRVTEAWDENGEHSGNSLHYEARAADITTSDKDGAKLGRLGSLATESGFDWVFFEDSKHIHVSVRNI